MSESVGERLGKLEERLSNTEEFLESISRRIEEQRKVQWGPMIGTVGLLLTIGSYAASFYVRDLAKVEKEVDKMEVKTRNLVNPDIYREDLANVHQRLRRLETSAAKDSWIANKIAHLEKEIEEHHHAYKSEVP